MKAGRTSKTAREELSGEGRYMPASTPKSGLQQERLSVWLQMVKLALAGQIFKLIKCVPVAVMLFKKSTNTRTHPQSVCFQPTTTVSIHYLFFAPYYNCHQPLGRCLDEFTHAACIALLVPQWQNRSCVLGLMCAFYSRAEAPEAGLCSATLYLHPISPFDSWESAAVSLLIKSP